VLSPSAPSSCRREGNRRRSVFNPLRGTHFLRSLRDRFTLTSPTGGIARASLQPSAAEASSLSVRAYLQPEHAGETPALLSRFAPLPLSTCASVWSARRPARVFPQRAAPLLSNGQTPGVRVSPDVPRLCLGRWRSHHRYSSRGLKRGTSDTPGWGF